MIEKLDTADQRPSAIIAKINEIIDAVNEPDKAWSEAAKQEVEVDSE